MIFLNDLVKMLIIENIIIRINKWKYYSNYLILEKVTLYKIVYEKR